MSAHRKPWRKQATGDRFLQHPAQRALSKEPNAGHLAIRRLEDYFEVEVITQNIDDLHERAGSSRITHLHGELRKLRSSIDETLTVPIEGWKQEYDTRCKDGSLLRPFVVFFGESVPMFDRAAQIASTADIFVIVGTSLARLSGCIAGALYPSRRTGLLGRSEPNPTCAASAIRSKQSECALPKACRC